MQLLPVPQNGDLPEAAASASEFFRVQVKQGALYYESVGYVPPWIGYVAMADGAVVGGCGFKGPPAASSDDVERVEIAYFTLPEHEGRGHATAMTHELIRLAREADPAITIAAQTLREEGPSCVVLRKNGFKVHAELVHPEDGEVWEWRLPNE